MLPHGYRFWDKNVIDFIFLFEQELILHFFSKTKTGFDVDETLLDDRDDSSSCRKPTVLGAIWWY
jgi:hypothetical protein